MLPRNLWGVLRGEGDRTRAAARRWSCTMRIISRSRSGVTAGRPAHRAWAARAPAAARRAASASP